MSLLKLFPYYSSSCHDAMVSVAAVSIPLQITQRDANCSIRNGLQRRISEKQLWPVGKLLVIHWEKMLCMASVWTA
jgi:hypothetical protein